MLKVGNLNVPGFVDEMYADRRRKKQRGKTSSIADLMPQVMTRIEKKAGGKLPVIVAKWPEIVGHDVAKHTCPAVYRSRRLTIDVDDSVWMAELSRFHKERIIEAINKNFGKEVVTEVRFTPKKAD